MAGEWRTATVAELQRDGILLVEDGNHGEYRPRPNEFVDRGFAFIRAADMDAGRVLFESAAKVNERARERITKGIGAPGDVLISHKGTVGKVALVPDEAPPFVCSPQTTFWRTRDENRLDRKYLYAFLRSPGFRAQLATRAGETDMAPYVSLTSQRGLSVALPPLHEQRAIAHILGTLDDKIELNRRMNETLEAMARALFKSWFVDFDPVRAKAAGHNPTLPRDIAALFPDEFEDSELGEIPSGWRVTALSEVAALNPETWSRDTMPETIEYVDLSSVKWGRIESTAVFPSESAPSRAQRIVRPGDTMVGVVRPGNGSFTLVAVDGLTGSTGFAVLRPKGPDVSEFLFLAATAQTNIDRLSRLADGVAYPAVRPEEVAATKAVFCGDALLAEFSRLTKPLLGRFATNERESRALAAIRDTLLPRLISGELRVA